MEIEVLNLGRNKINEQITLPKCGTDALRRYVKRHLLDEPFELIGGDEELTFHVVQGSQICGTLKVKL